MSDLFLKAKELLEKMQFKSPSDKLQAYENFIKEEIKPKLTVELSVRDLNEIRSEACGIAASLSYGEEVNGNRVYGDSQLLQPYCYFRAVYRKLRSKELIDHDILIGDSKDRQKKGRI
jgi:hypothetical protein